MEEILTVYAARYIGITPEQYNENNERYAEELNTLQRQESHLDSADQNFYVTVGYLLELFKNAKTLYARANTDEKREILKLLLSNIELDGKNIIFTLKKPFDTLVSISNGSLWLGMRDSNPRMLGPEPSALPLGESPTPPYFITFNARKKPPTIKLPQLTTIFKIYKIKSSQNKLKYQFFKY